MALAFLAADFLAWVARAAERLVAFQVSSFLVAERLEVEPPVAEPPVAELRVSARRVVERRVGAPPVAELRVEARLVVARLGVELRVGVELRAAELRVVELRVVAHLVVAHLVGELLVVDRRTEDLRSLRRLADRQFSHLRADLPCSRPKAARRRAVRRVVLAVRRADLTRRRWGSRSRRPGPCYCLVSSAQARS